MSVEYCTSMCEGSRASAPPTVTHMSRACTQAKVIRMLLSTRHLSATYQKCRHPDASPKESPSLERVAPAFPRAEAQGFKSMW